MPTRSTSLGSTIITNVTPLEPECQVLFFEADDDVCETSYADKNGEYQAQRGVTLPKL